MAPRFGKLVVHSLFLREIRATASRMESKVKEWTTSGILPGIILIR